MNQKNSKCEKLMAIIAGLIIIFCTLAIEAIFRIIIGVWISKVIVIESKTE